MWPACAPTRWSSATACSGSGWATPTRPTRPRSSQVEHWGDPAWGVNRGESMLLECNYLYMTDNLLDPSHVSWVHQSSFGGVQAMEDLPLRDHGGRKRRHGVALDASTSEPAPFYAPFLKFSGNCDRKQHYEVRYPSNAIIKAIFVPASTGGEGKPLHEDVFLMDSYNFMTPVDENHTRYYWFQMRNFAPDDEEVSRQFATSVRGAFDEDRVVLERRAQGHGQQAHAQSRPQDRCRPAALPPQPRPADRRREPAMAGRRMNAVAARRSRSAGAAFAT